MLKIVIGGIAFSAEMEKLTWIVCGHKWTRPNCDWARYIISRCDSLHYKKFGAANS